MHLPILRFVGYIKVPINEVSLMTFEDDEDSAILELPFARDIIEYKDLFGGVK